jgi:DNA repair exonuclease SbcCD nuclease subunit
MLNLVVGDPHVTPEELPDCEQLLQLVAETAEARRVDMVTFMGDQHNTHDAVSTRVIEFWARWFKKLPDTTALVGNHDMVSPTEQYPHSMISYPYVRVIDHGRLVLSGDGEWRSGFAAMPYFPDPTAFVAEARRLHEEHGDFPLYCHQTFAGAVFENGWKPEGAVDATELPQKHIISGHIHSPQAVSGKVFYVGAPRWRTRADAGVKRALALFEHTNAGTKLKERIDTGTRCSRIHCFQDSPDTPVDLDALFTAEDLKKDRIFVDVFGPISYTRPRETELKAAWGVRTRGFPDRERKAIVSESEGIEPGFARFSAGFRPPHGTDQQSLVNEAGRRLGIAA